MKIIIDVEGCDTPVKVATGAVNAAKAHPDHTIVIMGKEETISAAYQGGLDNVVTLACPDVVTNYDVPTKVIRQKPESSLIRAFTMLKEDEDAIGVVSAGSTGAVLTCATLLVGRINKDVHRPVMASLLPTKNKDKLVCICDCGSTMETLPEYMAQYAVMASEYVKTAFDNPSPRVGLLSVGTEDKKGDDRTKAAHALIKQLPINFAGNVEARDVLSGEYDVIVCDGFSGNVLVKSIEGTAMFVLSALKKEIKASTAAKIGAMFMKRSFKNLKHFMDYNRYGGAAFLGVKKPVIKSHGSSNEIAIQASVDRIIMMHKNNIIDGIRTGIAATITGETKVEA